jgi:hypothetical protein
MALHSPPDRVRRAAPRCRLAAELPLAAYETGLASAAGLLATAEEDRRLADRLLALPPREREDAALHDPRYRRPTLAQLLALRAESELFEPAGDPRATAELGAAIASALPRDPAGKARRLAALAHWLLGKALLKAAQWRPAESSFRCMFAFIPGRGPAEETALACAGLAQVCADTGDVDAAVAQFLQAAWVFSKLGAAAPAAGCQAELGLLLLDSGDLVNAGTSLRAAAELLDPAFAPSLAARLRLALAEVAAALGDRAAAGEELRRARALYRLAPAAAEGVERRRREARIAAASGDVAAADALLEPVRRELLARGSLDEAARSTFEHVLLRIEERRLGEVGELTGQLAAAFPGAGEGERWAEEMAGLARVAGTNPDGVYRACCELGLRLRLRLRQATPPDSCQAGRPPLVTPLRLLADRLLRRRGELEDPIGAGMGL